MSYSLEGMIAGADISAGVYDKEPSRGGAQAAHAQVFVFFKIIYAQHAKGDFRSYNAPVSRFFEHFLGGVRHFVLP